MTIDTKFTFGTDNPDPNIAALAKFWSKNPDTSITNATGAFVASVCDDLRHASHAPVGDFWGNLAFDAARDMAKRWVEEVLPKVQ